MNEQTRDLVDAQDVRVAFTTVADLLEGVAADDSRWDAPAGDIEWSCRSVVAHIANCGAWYAANLARCSTRIVETGEMAGDAGAPVLIDAVRSSAARSETSAGKVTSLERDLATRTGSTGLSS